jgi:hypothetical protein
LFPVVPAGETMTSERKLPLDKWWLSELDLPHFWPRGFKLPEYQIFQIISDSLRVFPDLICLEIVIFSPSHLPRIHCFLLWASLFARLI